MTELALHDLTFCVRRLPRDVKDMMKREGHVDSIGRPQDAAADTGNEEECPI